MILVSVLLQLVKRAGLIVAPAVVEFAKKLIIWVCPFCLNRPSHNPPIDENDACALVDYGVGYKHHFTVQSG